MKFSRTDSQITATPIRAAIALILPMFFALSGFLVAGSLLRCRSLVSFLGLRAIRIFPALLVETTISAIIIGPVMSTLELTNYFSNKMFFAYFYNIIGYIHYSLPGLFMENSLSGIVNGQLWTIPYELECYIALALAAMVGVKRHRIWILIAIGVVIGFQTLSVYMAAGANEIQPTAGAIHGRLLVGSFLLGVAMYLYREKIEFSDLFGVVALALSIALLLIPPYGDILSIVPISYLTAYLGLKNPSKLKILTGADYSYGIFLYGFVVQQTVFSINPRLNWIENFLCSITAVVAVAAISWTFVEKPAMDARKKLMAIEEGVLSRVARTRSGLFHRLLGSVDE